MSFSPPKTDDALVYYRKAYEIDPKNPFAALRIEQLLAQTGNHDNALKYLRIALGDTAKNPSVSGQPEKSQSQMGPPHHTLPPFCQDASIPSAQSPPNPAPR